MLLVDAYAASQSPPVSAHEAVLIRRAVRSRQAMQGMRSQDHGPATGTRAGQENPALESISAGREAAGHCLRSGASPDCPLARWKVRSRDLDELSTIWLPS